MAASQEIITMIRLTLLFYVIIKTSSRRVYPRPSIIGGIEAVRHSRPWMASIKLIEVPHGHHICGGSLIKPSWVLTAATCLSNEQGIKEDENKFELQLGIHNVLNENKNTENSKEKHHVGKIILHPKFKRDKMYHNIALIKLKEPVNLNRMLPHKYVDTIHLPPKKKYLKPGTIGSHIGWGAAQEYGKFEEGKTYTFGDNEFCKVTGKDLKDKWDVHLECGRWYAPEYHGNPGVRVVRFAPDALQEMYVRIMSKKNCVERLKIGIRFRNMIMCGLDEKLDRGLCWEDIGGPLAVFKKRKWTIHGIASYFHEWNDNKKKCGMKDNPQVFTRVAAYVGWINSKTTEGR